MFSTWTTWKIKLRSHGTWKKLQKVIEFLDKSMNFADFVPECCPMYAFLTTYTDHNILHEIPQ